MHASDSEKHSLVQYGAQVGLFGMVDKEDICRNQLGDLVLNGTMGFDKVKKIDLFTQYLLRLISSIAPINSYLRKLRGRPYPPALSDPAQSNPCGRKLSP